MDDAGDTAVKWGKTWQVARLLMFIVPINENIIPMVLLLFRNLLDFILSLKVFTPLLAGTAAPGDC